MRSPTSCLAFRRRARLRSAASARGFAAASSAPISTTTLRIAPGVTLALGVRWEYESPYTERDGRLANLDVLPGFTAAAPVVGADPTGPLTGTQFPASLVRRDALGFEPRVGVSWRPDPDLVARDQRRVRAVSQSRRVSVHRHDAGATAAVFDDLQPSQQRRHAVDPRQSVSGLAGEHTTTFAVDPNFTTALLHSFAGHGPAGSAWRR